MTDIPSQTIRIPNFGICEARGVVVITKLTLLCTRPRCTVPDRQPHFGVRQLIGVFCATRAPEVRGT